MREDVIDAAMNAVSASAQKLAMKNLYGTPQVPQVLDTSNCLNYARPVSQ